MKGIEIDLLLLNLLRDLLLKVDNNFKSCNIQLQNIGIRIEAFGIRSEINKFIEAFLASAKCVGQENR
ncbi:hypothetical protein HUJ04_011061 [Dendroctonus ponderosae]|nr:hypothetical protein HUJ04_011061 [Dendroctonus ponderosae]